MIKGICTGEGLIVGELYSIAAKSYKGTTTIHDDSAFFKEIGRYKFEDPFVLLEVDNSKSDFTANFRIKILYKDMVGWIAILSHDIITKLS